MLESNMQPIPTAPLQKTRMRGIFNIALILIALSFIPSLVYFAAWGMVAPVLAIFAVGILILLWIMKINSWLLITIFGTAVLVFAGLDFFSSLSEKAPFHVLPYHLFFKFLVLWWAYMYLKLGREPFIVQRLSSNTIAFLVFVFWILSMFLTAYIADDYSYAEGYW